MNTILALTASALTAGIASKIARTEFDISVLLKATLSGGVIIGATCNIITSPVIAIGCGAGAGLVSAYGFLLVRPLSRQRRPSSHDTCGVQYLHGLPGALSGVISFILFLTLDTQIEDGLALTKQFPLIDSGQRT